MLYKQEDLEIAISTMHQENLEFLFKMFPNDSWKLHSILIVNQTDGSPLVSNYENVRVLNIDKFGLSKSRNLILKQAKGKLILLSDDDVVFLPDFKTTIVKAFNSFKKLDVIRFQFLKQGVLAKNYPKQSRSELNWFQVLDASSVELVLKRESIQKFNLSFDEDFGLGASFAMGEEAVFLADLKAKKGKLGFVPKTILRHPNDTTGTKSTSKEIYKNQSAVFYRIFKQKYVLWILLKLFFDVKQHKIKVQQLKSLFSEAIKGKKAYVNHTKL